MSTVHHKTYYLQVNAEPVKIRRHCCSSAKNQMWYDAYIQLFSTAPVVQTFQTTDEYPLMEYHKGQPQAYSVNTNQMVRLSSFKTSL